MLIGLGKIRFLSLALIKKTFEKMNRELRLQWPKARFVKVYPSHKLCRNVRSHNNGIFPSYKCCENAEYHFLNQVQECQNFAIILWMVLTTFLTFNDTKST